MPCHAAGLSKKEEIMIIMKREPPSIRSHRCVTDIDFACEKKKKCDKKREIMMVGKRLEEDQKEKERGRKCERRLVRSFHGALSFGTDPWESKENEHKWEVSRRRRRLPMQKKNPHSTATKKRKGIPGH